MTTTKTQRQVQTISWFMYGKPRAYFAQRTKLRRILIAASKCCKNIREDIMRKTIVANALLGLILGVTPGLLSGYTPFDLQWWVFIASVYGAVIWRDILLS